MTHIAIIIPGLNRIGGAEKQATLLAHGLTQRGLRVTVIALSGDGGPAANALRNYGVEFISLRMLHGLVDPHGWLVLHDWLRREKPEILHAHLPHATWMARWSRLGAPVRVLIDTLHSSSTGTPGRRAGYRASNWLTDQLTAVSISVAQTHQSARMVNDGKVQVLANGVDMEHWHADHQVRTDLRSAHGLHEEFLWLAAGRLEPVKDYPTLLNALALTPARAYLVIAGAGRQEEELRRLAMRLNIGERVRFLGFEPDVRCWMQAADGFVLSSRWEGLPMALLEAAACELPIVSTRVSGADEIVTERTTGFLTSVGNADAFSEAMSNVMRRSPSQRAKMGALGRQVVVEKFSLDAVLDRWEALYKELLRANSSPRRWAK